MSNYGYEIFEKALKQENSLLGNGKREIGEIEQEIFAHLITIEVLLEEAHGFTPNHINEVLNDMRNYVAETIKEE